MSASKQAGRLSTVPAFTVWQEMTPLAKQYNAVNLGQGFPSFPPPPFLLKELQNILEQSATSFMDHQYARVQGDFELVEGVKRMCARFLAQPELSDDNVLIMNGTTQGLNVAFQALLDPGDEVVVFEPYYDAYTQDIQLAGGVVKFVQLIPGDKSHADAWYFTEEDLVSAVTEKTKCILVNTPQNVPGKAWSRKELELVARIATERDLIVIVDEVYMSLVYESSHLSLASMPGMWERVISLCSIGKTFACTGWKIGWAVGPSNLIASMSKVSTYQTFSVATPLQKAVARGLRQAENNGYYSTLVNDYKKRRTQICDMLSRNSLTPVVPSGGFFVLADISRVDPKHYYDPNDTAFARDWQFCRWLIRTIGVCAIPTTAFCTPESRKVYERYVRFAFCKTEDDIREAGVRLEKLRDYFLS